MISDTLWSSQPHVFPSGLVAPLCRGPGTESQCLALSRVPPAACVPPSPQQPLWLPVLQGGSVFLWSRRSPIGQHFLLPLEENHNPV